MGMINDMPGRLYPDREGNMTDKQREIRPYDYLYHVYAETIGTDKKHCFEGIISTPHKVITQDDYDALRTAISSKTAATAPVILKSLSFLYQLKGNEQ